jgi:hypothetical protein
MSQSPRHHHAILPEPLASACDAVARMRRQRDGCRSSDTTRERSSDVWTRLTVRLPTFLVVALHEWVNEANARSPQAPPRHTVSRELELILTDLLGIDELGRLLETSEDFRRTSQAWTRAMGAGAIA